MGGTAGSPLGGSAAAAAATAAVAAERERCARLRGELRDMREQVCPDVWLGQTAPPL